MGTGDRGVRQAGAGMVGADGDGSQPDGADPWSQVTVLLHVGLHKTGTTWLAERLFERPGNPDFVATSDRSLLYSLFINPDQDAFDPAAVRARLRPLAERAAAEGRVVALLGETLAGRPFHARYRREIHAERLRRCFPQARILLTIREQDAIIRSMYGQFVRFGYTDPLAGFLARPPAEAGFTGILDYGFYDYDRLHRLYAGLFGAGQVTLLPFEKILRDPAGAVADLSRLLGRPLAPVPSAEARERVNPGWSSLAYAAARQANRFRQRDTPWLDRGPVNPNVIGYWVDRLTPRALRERGAQRDRALIRAAVGDRYAASNRAVSDRLGLGLDALGYRCAPAAIPAAAADPAARSGAAP
jgi:hypothetical protein